ncbi:MAG: sulfatase-like hydrolase/transferase [Planctomycetaceae bacterium]
MPDAQMTSGPDGKQTEMGGWDGSINAPQLGEKGMLTEGGIREPFLWSWKGVIPAGQVFDHPVSSLDITATVLAAAGIEEREGLDGVDLLPHLTSAVTAHRTMLSIGDSGNKPPFVVATGSYCIWVTGPTFCSTCVSRTLRRETLQRSILKKLSSSVPNLKRGHSNCDHPDCRRTASSANEYGISITCNWVPTA